MGRRFSTDAHPNRLRTRGLGVPNEFQRRLHVKKSLSVPKQGGSAVVAQVKIKVLCMPADSSELPTAVSVDRGDVQFFQDRVDGYLEAVRLVDPAATMYVNDDGAGLLVNKSATAVVNRHGTSVEAVVVTGGVVIVGPCDDAGWSTDVPDFYVKKFVE